MTSPWLGLFSFVIAIPLRAARHMTWVYNGLQTFIGMATIALGIYTLVQTTSV